MFFRTKRQYFLLHNVPSTGYTFSVHQDSKRFFINFNDLDEFLNWYQSVPPYQKTLNEVILTDKRKFILDLDININYDIQYMHIYDFERHICNKIYELFQYFDIGNPNIIIYNMSEYEKISFHFVVSNFTFSAQTCLGLSVMLSKNKLWGQYVDTGVYKSTQFIRIEGSTKYQQKRWKKRSDSCLGPFKHGLLSCFDDTIESNFNNTVIYKKSYSQMSFRCIDNINFIKKQFVPRKCVNNTVFLQRVKSGYCPQCKRVHDNENAILKNSNTFICWRYYYKNSTTP